MKTKLFIIGFHLLSVFTLHAQDTSFATIGIKLGTNLSGLISQSYIAPWGGVIKGWNTSPQYGAIGGIVVDFRVSRSFYVQPELLVVMKGGVREKQIDLYSMLSGSTQYTNVTRRCNISLIYVETPIHITGKISLRSGKLFMGIGPYVSCGIYGRNKSTFWQNKTNITHQVSDEYVSQKVFSGKFKAYNIFDWGISAIAGYEFKTRIFINLGYSLGMIAISNESADNTRNTSMNLSVGYKF